jgi:hypothetical protein
MITVIIWGVVLAFYACAAFLAVIVAGAALWAALQVLRVAAVIAIVVAKPIIRLVKHV